ncbi:alpha/beta fold hydrolase [Phototrophicus methaneseepsis]|uniref:Alpha/beta fold hydrolase n=1 Tax=Phototrophicus methaneseepsis TaxID=2710758 RepID=A0A7S8IDC8_9CHLR|nr:alpha/beta fold hydrolase [Phototrophicus methaneseepsis]QPC81406.1 alpha/beta fold hydrolase [Phototrophicus methaneseepsis]
MFPFGPAYQGEHYQPFYWRGTHGSALLVHGFPGHPGDMRAIATHLHDKGWTVDVPLLPGFGSQIEHLPEYRYEDWLAATRSHLGKLIANNQRPNVLVGYSMGGAISMAMAADFDIDALILFAPFWRIEHMLWRMLPALKWFVPTFKPAELLRINLDDETFQAGLREIIPGVDFADPTTRSSMESFRLPTHVIDQVRVAGQNGHANAANITVPTLIVQGTRDDLAEARLTRKLADELSAPVTYVEVDCDHALLEDSQTCWPQVIEAVDAFIDMYHLGSTR